MAVYMMFWQEAVTDEAGLAEYSRQAGGTLGPYSPIPRVVTDKVDVVEGEWPAGRMVVLEFENREKALGWYNSPEYSAVKGLRHAATKGGGGIIVDAFQMPGQ